MYNRLSHKSKCCDYYPGRRYKNYMPRKFCDYMNGIDTRFSEICDLYLYNMSIDDVKYLHPQDLINLVLPEQYNHRLLMTVLTKRYIYRNCCEGCTEHHNDGDCYNDVEHHDGGGNPYQDIEYNDRDRNLDRKYDDNNSNSSYLNKNAIQVTNKDTKHRKHKHHNDCNCESHK